MANRNSIRYILRNADSIYKQLRWHGTVTGPHCGSTHVYNCSYGYKCADCRKRFTNYTNTIMHGSKLDTAAWVLTLYLMLDSRGISSVEVARKVGVTQKTAWAIMMKLRQAMSQDSVELKGVVSMDEAYLGGSWTNKPLRKQQQIADKYIPIEFQHGALPKETFLKINADIHTPIIGMNDGQNVILQVLPRGFTKYDIQDIFNVHASNVDMCVSDSSKLYEDWNVPFEHCNHGKRQYSTQSGYSSNNVEGLFSHLKRALRHNQVHISDKYMQYYLDELSFRWRHRLDTIHIKMVDSFNNSKRKPIKLVTPKRVTNPDIEFVKKCFSYGTLIREVELNSITYHNPKCKFNKPKK